MQLKSKCNKGIRFLICFPNIFSKYVWVSPLKNKRAITILVQFNSFLYESCRKPSNLWVD